MIVNRISCALADGDLSVLGYRNWVTADGVEVAFGIRHRGTSIHLEYRVREPQVRAVNTGFNTPVWEDSCVEFFISFDGGAHYYNLEFNAIGTVLGAWGPDREHRAWLPDEVLESIVTVPSLGKGVIMNLEGDIRWTLEATIPVRAFIHEGFSDIAGCRATANFYKCGDRLRNPHFLSWKAIPTEKPDFHRPEYFGPLEFGP
jgi:hypothetical protein